MRQRLKDKLIQFGRMMAEQEAQRESLKVYEPRSTEEQTRASDLLTLVLEYDDEVGDVMCTEC